MKKSAIAGLGLLGLLAAAGAYESSTLASDPMSLAEYNAIKVGSSEKDLLRYATTCQQEDKAAPGDGYPVTWTCYGADGSSNAVFFYSRGQLFSKSESGLE
ncbi:hypothetical protein [Streptomyces gilvosporeus]|uniref:DUF333 domain-containing protein n=1 Tax=Streptomyces gilvosporeus TaxID=553510 RepID=A0A1V0U1N2_9ACTN|nr:hypothetical protein [Streptomyces gilvosporeus]ARF59086.1 hypothetical protein B1H19_37280 [Streptomyces gilvosporeus]